MSVPAIALYASPPSGVCSIPHHSCQIASSHSPTDFDLNPRLPSSSAAPSSSSQKPIAGGLSCLFSSPAARHAPSSSFTGGDELGSHWHDRSEELSSFFCYSSYPSSSFKCGDQSPASVFQGPVSCSGSGSARIPPLVRTTREWSSDDWRVGKDRIFSCFVRNALISIPPVYLCR